MSESLEWCVVVWNAVPDKDAGLMTFGTALLGGLFVLLGAWGSLYFQAKRENSSVRAALLAEIEALLDLCERHRYARSLIDVLEGMRRLDIKTRQGMGTAYYSVKFDISQAYNQIYQANAQKIGSLSPDDAKQVVRFYQLMASVRRETSEGGRLYVGTTQVEAYEIASQNFLQAIEIGERLIGRSKSYIVEMYGCGHNVDI